MTCPIRQLLKTATQASAIICIVFLLTACGGGGGEGESGEPGDSGSKVGDAGGNTGDGTTPAAYGVATLSWQPPTENTDGSVLTNLAGYKIYYGTEAGNYTEIITIDNPGIAEYIVDNLPPGNTYYFVITAFNAEGIESEFSPAGSKVIPA